MLWDMVIPLLPAVFIVNPHVWRNVCPLATLNELSGNRPGRQTMEPRITRAGWMIGITLLFALVPARRFLFNENGPALGVAIALVAVLAVGGGVFFSRRAGFCSSICPILPVEKLYGQRPLVAINGARCDRCTLCTSVGCIDLAAAKTLAQTIGPLRRDTRWLRTAFGVFAASFPGLILGYFVTPNGDLATAGSAYVRTAGLAGLSYLVVTVTATALRVRAAVAMPFLGATALATYYWFASPALVTAYHAPSAVTPYLRALVGVTLASWLWKAVPRST